MPTHQGTADIEATATVSMAAGSVTIAGAGALNANAAVSPAATMSMQGAGALSAAAAVAAVGGIKGPASAALNASATISGTGALIYRGLTSISGSAAVSALGGIVHPGGGAIDVSASVDAEETITFAGQGSALFSASAAAVGDLLGEGLGANDVIQEIFHLWGLERGACSLENAKLQAVNILNWAMQKVWARFREDDYFSRVTRTYAFDAGEAYVELESDVQNALGPARLDGSLIPLIALSSRSQLDQYGYLFLGQAANAVAQGTPEAYYIERTNQSRPDNVLTRLYLVPVPDPGVSVLLDVSVEPRRYEWEDVQTDRPLQIPHRYVELILLPLCRYQAMRSRYFATPEAREHIKQDYAEALAELGVVDPLPKEADER